jgi:hypothetical protein
MPPSSQGVRLVAPWWTKLSKTAVPETSSRRAIKQALAARQENMAVFFLPDIRNKIRLPLRKP